MKTTKFDLEKALKGEKVVTRSGREVTDLHYFKNAASNQQRLIGLVGDEVQTWYDSGKWSLDVELESIFDLFMLSETKSVWVNVYDEREPFIRGPFTTKEYALKSIVKEFNYIKTIEITNEKE